MTTIIAFDPGFATGVAEGEFSDTEPLLLVDADTIPYTIWTDAWVILSESKHDHIVAEKFELSSGNEFTADLTGVKVEGTLELLYGNELKYRTRDSKQQIPDEFLQEIGMWKTNDEVDWENARDANDAIIHLLGYVAFDLQHKPTLRKYFK